MKYVKFAYLFLLISTPSAVAAEVIDLSCTSDGLLKVEESQRGAQTNFELGVTLDTASLVLTVVWQNSDNPQAEFIQGKLTFSEIYYDHQVIENGNRPMSLFTIDRGSLRFSFLRRYEFDPMESMKSFIAWGNGQCSIIGSD